MLCCQTPLEYMLYGKKGHDRDAEDIGLALCPGYHLEQLHMESLGYRSRVTLSIQVSQILALARCRCLGPISLFPVEPVHAK